LSLSAFEMGDTVEILGSQYERQVPGPAPNRHIDDAIGVAQHPCPVGEMRIENPIVATRFKDVALDCVILRVGCEMSNPDGKAVYSEPTR
jgi:hypothetical protein